MHVRSTGRVYVFVRVLRICLPGGSSTRSENYKWNTGKKRGFTKSIQTRRFYFFSQLVFLFYDSLHNFHSRVPDLDQLESIRGEWKADGGGVLSTRLDGFWKRRRRSRKQFDSRLGNFFFFFTPAEFRRALFPSTDPSVCPPPSSLMIPKGKREKMFTHFRKKAYFNLSQYCFFKGKLDMIGCHLYFVQEVIMQY